MKKKKDAENGGHADPRCSSGITGLDDIMGGGFPREFFYLIQGDPGSGKTTLAMQFLLEGIRRKESVFYITLSETRAELVKVARSHDWNIDDIPMLELSAVEALMRPELQTTVFHPSEVELTKVTRLLLEEAAKHKPIRLVFDSLSELRLMAETPLRYRRQLLSLKHEFAKYKSTVLLLDDKMDSGRLGLDPHVLSLTHGVIEMEQLSPDYGTSRRRLRVMKMRGVKFREGYHDYLIAKGGLHVFPRLVAAEHHVPFKHVSIPSGIAELDDLFGGGLDTGTTTLIMGHAGTGKSTLAVQYAVQMAIQREKCLIFAFEETREVLLRRAKMLGLSLDKFVRDGSIEVQQVDPAEISPGEFAARIRAGVEAGCKLVVIDSLNGYMNAMPGEKYLINQLHELSAYLNQQGVLTILVLAQHGLTSTSESSVELSYLADTVVNLRFFEASGMVKQAMAVLKKRSGHHEKSIREYKLESGKGIRVGKPLTEFRGVLTGAPIFTGDAKQIMTSSNARK